MKWFIFVALVTLASAFKEIQDGAKILPDYNASKDTYSIPLRGAIKGQQSAAVEENAGLPGFDHAEFDLISRMKTIEIPPSEDSVHYYASSRQLQQPSNRFNRNKRSPQGLKFDGQDSKGSSEGSASKQQQQHPKSINEQLPRAGGSGSVNFNGPQKGGNKAGAGAGGDENKRLFPFDGGFGPYGQFGGNYGGLGGHHFYPTAGFQGYPGGGYYGGGYPGAGYPGFIGGTGGGSSASASASSSGNNLGGYRPGFGGGGLYGNGYYPGGGYGYGQGYPTTYPILGGGGFGPGLGGGVGGFGGGFPFRDESGKGASKVTAGAVSSGGKVAGGVSFE